MSYRQILLAVDLSEDSDAIGRRAAAIAAAFGANVTLLHVVEFIPMDPSGEALMPPPVDLESELLASGRTRLAELAERLGLRDSRQEIVLGGIKTEIVRVATEIGADLIVLGSHQRHGLALMLGSTERSLLSATPCDVLAVRVQGG